jgi:hypothetical protein
MHRVLKRTTIREEARYSIDFSLEHVPESVYLHESQASSNIDFSTMSTTS